MSVRKKGTDPPKINLLSIYSLIFKTFFPFRAIMMASVSGASIFVLYKIAQNFDLLKKLLHWFFKPERPTEKQLTSDTTIEKYLPEIPFAAVAINYDMPLGAGGFGAVYLGRYHGDVAVKIFKAAENSKTEIQAHVKLNHSRVVQMFGFTVNPETKEVHLVMELMRDGSLEQLLRQDNKLNINEVLKLASEIAEGISFLHEKKIIHRDLKPANILLHSNRTSAKISDFGTARFLEGESGVSSIHGTPVYWAPELLEPNVKYDTSLDIYAFGAILYEMLTNDRLSRSNRMNMIERLESWRRHFKPLLYACCAQNPKERPGIANVLTQLKAIRVATAVSSESYN